MEKVSGERCALASPAMARKQTTPAEQMPRHGRLLEHEGTAMVGGATGPQIAAVALLTLLALAAGVLVAGFSGGLIMSRTTESIPMAHAGGDA